MRRKDAALSKRDAIEATSEPNVGNSTPCENKRKTTLRWVFLERVDLARYLARSRLDSLLSLFVCLFVCLFFLGFWWPRRRSAHRDKDLADREAIRRDLEYHISVDYPDARLTLFGSSCNGFGLANSDLDLCLQFDSNPDGKVRLSFVFVFQSILLLFPFVSLVSF